MTDDIDTLQMRVKYLEYVEKENKELRQRGTLRDKFAMAVVPAVYNEEVRRSLLADGDFDLSWVADEAYAIADAMMAARGEEAV